MVMKLPFFIFGACFLQGAGQIFQGSADTQGRRMDAGSLFGSNPPECYADFPDMQCLWDDANALWVKADAYWVSIRESDYGLMQTILHTSAEKASVACYYQSTLEILESLTAARCCSNHSLNMGNEISGFLKGTTSDFNCLCNVCPRYRFVLRALASVVPEFMAVVGFLMNSLEPTATELASVLDAVCPFEDALTCLSTEGGCAAEMAQMGFVWEYLRPQCGGRNISLDDTAAAINEPLTCKPKSTSTVNYTSTATTTIYPCSFTSTVTVTGTETSLPATSTSTLLPVTSTSVAGGETTAEPEPVANVVEVTLTMTVDDPTTITNDETLTTAMVDGFADLMGVDPSLVTLTFEVVRRLGARRLQVTLRAIFTVTMPTAEAAEEIQQAIDAVPIADTNTAITAAVQGAGYSGTIEVTGKETVVVEPEPPSKASFTSMMSVMQAILMPGLVVLSLNF